MMSLEEKMDSFFPNKSISEIIFATFILSLSSNTSDLLIESLASDHACPMLDTSILGSRFICK